VPNSESDDSTFDAKKLVSPVSALHGLLPRRSIYDSAIPRGAASRLAHPSVRSKERI